MINVHVPRALRKLFCVGLSLTFQYQDVWHHWSLHASNPPTPITVTTENASQMVARSLLEVHSPG